jgi:hypothetical protein
MRFKADRSKVSLLGYTETFYHYMRFTLPVDGRIFNLYFLGLRAVVSVTTDFLGFRQSP